MTVAQARRLLLNRADAERAEERPDPPTWAPFAAMHPVREITAARVAARTRVEHALRLAELPDRVLVRMLADGWTPHAVNGRYVNLRDALAGQVLPRRSVAS